MQKNPRSVQNNTDETELVHSAKEGDAARFALLVEQYMPVLWGCVSRYSKTAGVDTEDFIQEGLLALYRAVKSFDPQMGIRFRTYAITCINNSMASAIRTHLRLMSRQGDHLDDMDERHLHRQASVSADDLEELFIQRETNSRRQRQIEVLLSDFERHVLMLYLDGQTYQEIARVLRTTTKAVDNALQRVRRKLRPEF